MSTLGNHRRGRLGGAVELLEPRRLLSGTWSTQDALPSSSEGVGTMAADRFGNVYAAGDVIDSSGDVWVIREKPNGSSTWTTVANFGTSAGLKGLSTDANGNLFFTAHPVSPSEWTTWELVGGAGNPVEIDDAGGGFANASAVDAAGNVYVVGKLVTSAKTNTMAWAVRKGVFNTSTGKWSFTTVDLTTSSMRPESVAVATVGTSTTVYVAGKNTTSSSSTWVVRKSTNGGAWSTVDSFKYDSTGGNSFAYGVAADPSGDVYVVGDALDGVLTGYTKKNTPIYSRKGHWVVRKSADGGSTWGTVDDYQAPGGEDAFAVAVDPLGAVYVAGDYFDSAGNAHAVVRSNAGGTWGTVDDFVGDSQAQYFAVAADSLGNHYAGGNADVNGQIYDWAIRSDAPVASPSGVTATAAAVFSSSSIQLTPGTADDGLGTWGRLGLKKRALTRWE